MFKFTFKSSILSIGCLIFLCFTSFSELNGQRFKGSAVLGLNFAQIDGDLLYGYNKVGITGGFKLEYPIAEKFDVSLEMLYSQRGSTPGFGFGGGGDTIGLGLQYLSVPLTLSIKDWEVKDEGYFKVSAHAGLSPGYQFNFTSLSNSFPGNDDLAKVDLSYLLGVTYRFNKALGLTVRYTRSMTNLLDSNDVQTSPKAIGYFITIRTEYTF